MEFLPNSFYPAAMFLKPFVEAEGDEPCFYHMRIMPKKAKTHAEACVSIALDDPYFATRCLSPGFQLIGHRPPD